MDIRRCVLIVCVGVSLAACGSVPWSSPTTNALAATYNAAAEPSVASFRFVYLVSGKSLGDDELVVRTWPTRLWLLSVEPDCRELKDAWHFGVTALLRQVAENRDRVVFDAGGHREACNIVRIRPVNVARLVSAGSGRTAQAYMPPIYTLRR
jgi:hypothetical protein